MLTRVATWRRYVPAVGENRARYTAGEPALVVEIRPPTARTWRRFLLALTPVNGEAVEFKPGTVYRALLEDTTAEILWFDCVGAVHCPPGLIEGLEGPPPPDGAALWALRGQLGDFAGYTLIQDILNACLGEATLEAGLADFLASGSGPPPSSGAPQAGIAGHAASGA